MGGKTKNCQGGGKYNNSRYWTDERLRKSWGSILVVFPSSGNQFSLSTIYKTESQWQQYLTKYPIEGPEFLNHVSVFTSMDIHYNKAAIIDEKLLEAHDYIREAVEESLPASSRFASQAGSNFPDATNFTVSDSGKVFTKFRKPFDGAFYNWYYRIRDGNDDSCILDYNSSTGKITGIDILLREIKVAGPPTSRDLIAWLFLINPLVVETLRARSDELLEDVFKKTSFRKHQAVDQLAKTNDPEMLEKIAKSISNIEDSTTDPAGFGASRTWSEQCLLNKKMNSLARFHKGGFLNSYSDNPKEVYPKRKKSFFIDSEQPSTLINQLTAVPGSSTFLNMKNDKYSNLLPRIELYAINYKRKADGTADMSSPTNLEQIMFPQNTQVFGGTNIGRGDYGIKSFSWDLIGSNPRTKRNDIQAELSIYFQSLDQIFDKNLNNNLIKLLKRPPSLDRKEEEDSTKKPEENDISCNSRAKASSLDRALNLEYYELKALVGWKAADNSTALSVDDKKAIKAQNLSLYLTLIDHTFNFSQDGTFTLTITYRGRAEEMLSKHVADALATPKFKLEREIYKIIKNYATGPSTGSEDETKKDKLEEFNKEMEEHNADFKREAFSSIIRDMSDKNQIFYSHLKSKDMVDFINKGVVPDFNHMNQFYTDFDIKGGLAGAVNPTQTHQDLEIPPEESEEESTKDEEKDIEIGSEYHFSFFFLGDLLDTIFERSCIAPSAEDSVLEKFFGTGGKARNVGLTGDECDKARKHATIALGKNKEFYEQLKNTKLILGSLPLIDSSEQSECTATNYNLAQIPISTTLFKDWFAHKVVGRGIDIYPFTQFARDIMRELVIYSLREQCGETEKLNVVLKTTSLTGRREIQKALPFATLSQTSGRSALEGTHADNYISIPSSATANFNQSESEGTKLHSIIIIYAEDSKIRSLRGDPSADASSGVHHLRYGRDRGIVKQIQFTKNDVPGLREAKFSRDALNPLTELSTMYNASITTVGNIVFWPGQKVYIDPMGMGHKIGNPSDANSIAGVLGLGGYYTIADVRSSVEASSFTTTIKAIWESTGQDGMTITQVTTGINSSNDADVAAAAFPIDEVEDQ